MTPTVVCISPNDPRYFTCTSDKDYDRHRYKLVFDNGRKPIVFESYDLMKAHWFESVRNVGNCKVVVLDAKGKKNKGFN